MDYKKYIKNQIDEFSAKGFKRTFTPVYRFKDTFPFTKIDFNNIEEEHHSTNTRIWCSNDY